MCSEASATASALAVEPTYSVSTSDHEHETWEPRERRASKWDLRRWLRKLYAESWDHVSILIERNA
jgi:hypothetical protein